MTTEYRINNNWTAYQEESNKGWDLENIRIKDPEIDLGNVYKIAIYNKIKNIYSIITIDKKYVNKKN